MIIRRHSWIVVPTQNGGETTAVTRNDISAKNMGGRRRKALDRLDLYKANTRDGQKHWWSIPAGTEFTYVSGPPKEKK